MKAIRFNVSQLLRPVGLLLSLCICTLLVLGPIQPYISSYSNASLVLGQVRSGSHSSPTKGEDKLLTIEKKSQEAVLENPYSLEKTQEEANKGINEIQGSADADKMKRPDNTPSSVESIEEKVEKALEKVTGK